jgi:putative oxidoreductase
MFPLYFLYDMWPVLILRIALGVIFVTHGWPKIRDLKQNAKNFSAMGFKPGGLFGAIAAFLEFFGGIALIVGLGTAFFAALFVAEFAVILIWKWSKGVSLKGENGWELDLIILASVFALFALGGGAYSIDRIMFGLL